MDRPALTLGADELDHMQHGRPWPATTDSPAAARAYSNDGRFAGLLQSDSRLWRPKLLFLDSA